MAFQSSFSNPNFGLMAGQMNITNSTVNVGPTSPLDLKGRRLEHLSNFQTKLTTSSECLQSLYFPGMPIRPALEKERAEGTCEWIYEHKQNESWLSRGGILWIQGRAGSGKSTLMNRMVILEEHKAGAIVLSFFFDRTGSKL